MKAKTKAHRRKDYVLQVKTNDISIITPWNQSHMKTDSGLCSRQKMQLNLIFMIKRFQPDFPF